ncbi:hypothetical protein RhiirA1_454887 [Rhizophagus irregularis]|uniref:HAT C-terminal dimerisation domain-containing protein n=1 Tax=Rhizophagus irregularis TaxID=588596 RepID=A0A2N0S4B4_9GLOM|nr:hypothetical protein RhiirA1_454887 [Rhizophagus irregularis]
MGGRENSIECWWSYVEQDEGEENFIQQLALKIFSITPYNAGCERIFSVIGLSVNHLQNLTKLHTYYVLNAKTELKFTAKDLNVTNEEEFYQLVRNEHSEHLYFITILSIICQSFIQFYHFVIITSVENPT